MNQRSESNNVLSALALGVGIGGAAVVADRVIRNLPSFGGFLDCVALVYSRQTNPDEFDHFVMHSVRKEWILKSWTNSTAEVWNSFISSYGIVPTEAEKQRIEQKLVAEFWNSIPKMTVNLDWSKYVSGGHKKGRYKKTFRSSEPKLLEASFPEIDVAKIESVGPLERSALLFLKEICKSHSRLTEGTALREAKRVLKPLVVIEFSKSKVAPPKPRKKKTPAPMLERLLVLYNEQAAVQLGCSVDEICASKDVTRIEFGHWARIVRTEIPDASREIIEAVRSEVYVLRRSNLPSKVKKQKR
jgi:hypothetical protein